MDYSLNGYSCHIDDGWPIDPEWLKENDPDWFNEDFKERSRRKKQNREDDDFSDDDFDDDTYEPPERSDGDYGP